MSDFDTRPKGTVMYGAFNAFAPAERALRVLKNAGYARASFEAADAAFEAADTEKRPSDAPTILVVDAAAAGATRAAEILEEHGAHLSFAPEYVTPEPEPETSEVPQAPVAAARPERKPRVRRRARSEPARPNGPVANVTVSPPIESAVNAAD